MVKCHDYIVTSLLLQILKVCIVKIIPMFH